MTRIEDLLHVVQTNIVQSTDNGVNGVLLDNAAKHVVMAPQTDLAHVTLHCPNMVETYVLEAHQSLCFVVLIHAQLIVPGRTGQMIRTVLKLADSEIRTE